jgi:3-dehydroquinate dehydratase type I
MSFIAGHKPEKCKLIVSSHNYEYTPSCEEITNLVASIQAVGADIVKVATTAKDIVDVSRMFQVMVHCQVSVFLSEMLFVLHPPPTRTYPHLICHASSHHHAHFY